MQKFLIAGVALVMLAGCGSTSVSGRAQLAQADGDATEMICRTSHDVGSNMPVRECRTRGQWQAEADETRQSLEQLGRTTDPAATAMRQGMGG